MKRLSIFSFLLMMAAGLMAQTPAAKNFTLLNKFPCGTFVNDVVGYAAPNGAEYAIVGRDDGVSIVSLANPASPVLLQHINGVNTIWREIDVYQQYAYISNESGGGLRIINLTNLPGTVTWKDTVMAGMTTGHTVMVSGHYLFVHGSNIDNSGTTFFDLTDPWRPARVGAYTDAYVHDAYIRNDTMYTGEIYDGFMRVVDVRNKTNPVVLGSVITPSQFTHNTWLNSTGKVVYTTDEVDSAWIAAYDLSNLSNIVEVDRIRCSLSNGQAIPHNVKVKNDYLVTSYYKDGIQMVDGSRPNNLIEVGYYDTYPSGSGGGFEGCWSSDPYLPSGIVLGGNMDGFLFVLQPNYKRGCYLEGVVTDSVTGLPIAGADISIAVAAIQDLSRANGNYATGVADSGSYSVTYSKMGYVSRTINVTLDDGVLIIRNIALAPVQRIHYNVTVLETGSNAPVPQAKVEFSNGGGMLSYLTDNSGIVNDTAFIPGSYSLVVGHWGHRTKLVPVVADQGNPNVTVYLDKGYYDDYYFDFGWTTSTNATSGAWERGEPAGTSGGNGNPVQTDDDLPNDLGVQCYVTGNTGGQASTDDVDNGTTLLTSPPMDLTGFVNPVLKYYRWFANSGGQGGPINDSLLVRISDGTQTVTLTRIYGDHTSWIQDTFRISDFMTPGANMTVTFECGDYSPGHLVEGAVDQFEVTYDALATGRISGRDRENFVMVSPNPSAGAVRVEYQAGAGEDAQLEVTDLTGKEVYRQRLAQTSGSVMLRRELPAGMYVVRITNGQGAAVSTKFIRQ